MKKLSLILSLTLVLSAAVTTAVTVDASILPNNQSTLAVRTFNSKMKTSAYIYEWPSIYGHIKGYVPKGATIRTTGKVTNNMVQITYKGITGYVPVDAIDAKG